MVNAIEWAILIVLLVLGIYFGLPALVKPVLRRRFLGQVRRGGCACLTFDDGPDPNSTPQILDALAGAGVPATFFMIGERVRRHPELAARIARAGHEIGEHGSAHKNALRSGPLASAWDLLNGGKALAESCNDSQFSTLRPPFGKLNLVTLLYAALKRRRLIFWDVDPKDFAASSPDDVARHVLERLAPGRVILLHDGRLRPGASPNNTPAALRLILRRAASSGIRFATVGEALKLGAGDASRRDP